MLFLGVKPKVSHKWFRKTICSVDINYLIFFHELKNSFKFLTYISAVLFMPS